MKKTPWTVTAGVLLIIYSIINFGAGLGQLGKAKVACKVSTVLSSAITEVSDDNIFKNRIDKEIGYDNSSLYFIGLFILAVAVFNIVGSIGLFSGSDWAFGVVAATALCGIIVEIQDTVEDGFGIGKAIFFFINIFAFIAAYSARKKDPSLL